MHWLMLLLITAVYALMEFKNIFPKGTPGRDAMKQWHFTLGLLVFILAWPRLILYALSPKPLIAPAPPAWQEKLAGAVKILLYILMIGLPFAGWLALSAGGGSIPFFGLDLPALMSENKDLSKKIKDVHEIAATAGYFVIGLHAAAALFHHYRMRDNTLLRMLPRHRGDR
jgi:cytochrome b561